MAQSSGGKLSLSLPVGAATDGTDIANPTAMPAGGSGPRGWLSAIWTRLNGTLTVAFAAAQHVIVDAAPTTPVTGAFWQATQPVSGAVAVSNFPATQAVSLATNAPDVTDRAGRALGVVTQQSLTKGTQGANGVSTQDLKDAGRTAIVLSVTAVASVTTEAMFTLNIWKAGTVTSATSYTVTAGKTFRIQAIQFGVRFTTPSTTVTFASTTFVVRQGAGSVTATSNVLHQDSKLAASNAPVPNSDLPIPDGLELPAGTTIGVSHLASAATLSEDVAIFGYLY